MYRRFFAVSAIFNVAVSFQVGAYDVTILDYSCSSDVGSIMDGRVFQVIRNQSRSQANDSNNQSTGICYFGIGPNEHTLSVLKSKLIEDLS